MYVAAELKRPLHASARLFVRMNDKVRYEYGHGGKVCVHYGKHSAWLLLLHTTVPVLLLIELCF